LFRHKHAFFLFVGRFHPETLLFHPIFKELQYGRHTGIIGELASGNNETSKIFARLKSILLFLSEFGQPKALDEVPEQIGTFHNRCVPSNNVSVDSHRKKREC